MALRVQDCGAMIEAAEKANRRLFIVKQNRYNPPVVAVKQLLDCGRLGEVHSAHLNCFWNRNEDYYRDSWKGTRELDGGILFTQFSHFVDLLYWLIGDVESVQALVDNYQHKKSIEFEDAGAAVLRFQSGALGTVSFNINSHSRNMEGSLTLFCEKGTIKIGGQYLNELEYQSLDGEMIEGLPQGGGANEYGHYQGSMSNHDKVYENVIDVLTGSGVIGTAGYEGLKTVEIIDKIYRSAQDET
jgi:UDP-N-acetyl-2-amino-2-deoxyglucuronate dehydrogenase